MNRIGWVLLGILLMSVYFYPLALLCLFIAGFSEPLAGMILLGGVWYFGWRWL